jgi:drug/metabolite transporter (DMT)-like permease
MSLYPPFVIWSRAFIAAILLAIFIGLKQPKLLILPFKDKQMLLSGVLLCIHWVLFFFSVNLSTVAIAAISVFTYPIFTALLEPFIRGTVLMKRHILLGIVLLLGLYLVSPNLSCEDDMFIGALCGLGSALAYALRNIVSKNLLGVYNSWHIMYYQVLITAILLIPFSTYHDILTVKSNLFPLISLGIFPTVIGHGVLVKSFKYFTTSRVSILMGIQPIYTIVLGVLLLDETVSIRVVFGGVLILLTVYYELIQTKS